MFDLNRLLAWLQSLRGIRLAGVVVAPLPIAGGLAWLESLFRPEGAPGVLDLELAFFAGRFDLVLSTWDPLGVALFRWSLALDFLFAVAYPAATAALYFALARWLGAPPRALFGLAPLLAGALDWVENVFLLILSFETLSPSLVFAMSAAAALKFSLLLLVALGVAVAVFDSPLGPVLVTCRYSLLSVLLGALLLIGVPQGQDMLRALVDRAIPFWPRLFSFVGLALWALSVWYWSRVLLTIRFGAAPAPPARLVVAVPRLLGVLTPVVAGCAFLRAARGAPRAPFLLLCAGACFLQAALVWVFVTKRRQWLGLAPVAWAPWPQLPWITRAAALGWFLVSMAFLLLFTGWPVFWGQRLGALTVLCLAAANAVLFGSATVFLGRLWRVLIVTLALAGAAVFSLWNDNHAVRVAGGLNRDAAVSDPSELVVAFDAWFRDREGRWPHDPNRIPVFLVAAEGGGIRAAYWTASALARLSDLNSSFADHAFATSGVSGGSLGAATYVALLADVPPPLRGETPPRDPGPLERRAQNALAADFVSPVLAKMVAPDFLQWFLPFPVPCFDRAWALEDSWAAAYARANAQSPRFDQPFRDLWAAGTTRLPALFLNGTHVESGRRLILSNLTWSDEDIPDARNLHDELGFDLPLKTAVHNSARFAYVSPAGSFTSSKGVPGHIVDGGYFENSGTATLHDIWHRLLERSRMADRARFVALYLCNNPERCWGREDDSRRRPSGLPELFSPVRALLGAREARGGLSLAELKRESPGRPRAEGRNHEHSDHAIELVEIGVCAPDPETQEPPVPLGWQLSAGMREQLAGRLRDCADNQDAFRRLERILAGGP